MILAQCATGVSHQKHFMAVNYCRFFNYFVMHELSESAVCVCLQLDMEDGDAIDVFQQQTGGIM